MNEENILLTKTCLSCNLPKPLSAFLQFNVGEEGPYNDICNACRAEQQTEDLAKDKEEGTRASSGLKIDAKAKLHLDMEKNLLQKNKEEADHELKLKEEQLNTDKVEDTLRNTKEEAKSREDRKEAEKPDIRPEQISQKPIVGGEEQQRKEGEVNVAGRPANQDFLGAARFQGPEYEKKLSQMGILSPSMKKKMQTNPKQTAEENKTFTPPTLDKAKFSQFKTWAGEKSATVQRIEAEENKNSPKTRR